MADLLWDDVRCFFDPEFMGALPDVRVPNTSVEDWQLVLDLVAEKGWKCQYSEGETVFPVPRAEAVLSRPADAECPDLRVWPSVDVLAIFRFHVHDEVDFDVDLRELQGQERLDVFCGFLRDERAWRSVVRWVLVLSPPRRGTVSISVVPGSAAVG
ncbi:hypothetical protein ACFUTV_43800 [Streptomyces sp. NPDC057298]|uniref:hypothetical protein n=1 Tax=Streptomyces sp. NPDC057298 TaxID=3346091 RepID=UPI003639156E